MTDLILAAHADLVEARQLLMSADAVTWKGPAADSFHERLADASAATGALAAAVGSIGPPTVTPWRLPLAPVLP